MGNLSRFSVTVSKHLKYRDFAALCGSSSTKNRDVSSNLGSRKRWDEN
jgi:hypothetical protein